MENWKDVKGFEGRFKISDYGRLISINGRYKGEMILKTNLDSTGYYVTQLRMKPKNRRVRIHQLVGEHFLVQPMGLHHPCINHVDGNKTNNHVSNLEWTTKKENCLHAVRTGLNNQKGEKSSNSKLKDEDVLLIRELHKQGFNSSEISDKIKNKVNRRHVGDIINRVNWKHL